MNPTEARGPDEPGGYLSGFRGSGAVGRGSHPVPYLPRLIRTTGSTTCRCRFNYGSPPWDDGCKDPSAGWDQRVLIGSLRGGVSRAMSEATGDRISEIAAQRRVPCVGRRDLGPSSALSRREERRSPVELSRLTAQLPRRPNWSARFLRRCEPPLSTLSIHLGVGPCQAPAAISAFGATGRDYFSAGWATAESSTWPSFVVV